MSFKPPPMKRWHKIALGGGAATLMLAQVGTYFEGPPPHQGDQAVAYWDAIGHRWTICYGETEGVHKGDVRPMSECAADFAKAAKPYLDAARAMLPPGSPETRVAGIADWLYNVGRAQRNSSVIRKIRSGDIQGGCDALLLYDRAKGVEYYGLWSRRYVDRYFCLVSQLARNPRDELAYPVLAAFIRHSYTCCRWSVFIEPAAVLACVGVVDWNKAG